MAISTSRYVQIVSGTNTTKTASRKELIARLFTTNEKVPVDGVIEFSSLADVANFFSVSSDEYKIARIYFNFTSKYFTRPQKISFSRDFRGGINAFVYATVNPVLSALQAITAGSLDIKINGISANVSDIDLSSVSDFETIASVLQAAIRAANTDAAFANATVTYTSDGTFELTAGSAGNYSIEVSDGVLAQALGWQKNQNPINSQGAAETATIEDVLNKAYENSNNFATFAFVQPLTETDIQAAATWNNDIHSTELMFVAKVTAESAMSVQSLVANMNGTSLELCDDGDGKYNFVIPMAIAATTDYERENGIQNYMYQQIDDVAVMVDSDKDADTYDKLKVNYYGRTQQAGQKLSFYQRGVLQGNYQDQNIYVNEIWLKDALTVTYLNYMLNVPNWYANLKGKAIGQALVQDVILEAKTNGTITTEKEISKDDKVYILNITSDDNAWRQIYQEGYYLITSIVKKTVNNQTDYVFNYTLLYSKGDSIKKVEGKDILI